MADYQAKPRDQKVMIKLFDNPASYYVFKTVDLADGAGISSADIQALGHLPYDSTVQGLLFYRANAPKPARVKKGTGARASTTTRSTCSTYCGQDKLQAAYAAGWELVTPQLGVSLNIGYRSTTAIAQISNGALYAFPLNIDVFNEVKTDLGLLSPIDITSNAERNSLVRASSIPRPGKMQKPRQTQSGDSRRITFCSTDSVDTAIAAGWSRVPGPKGYERI